MRKPKICAVVTDYDIDAIKAAEPAADLFEVRIDLIGDRWVDVAHSIKKPWIACNRSPEEGGKWTDSEARRIEKLLQAMELGASIVDVELSTKNLDHIVAMIKKRAACMISMHDFTRTPPLDELKGVVSRQLKAGADACKVVTMAQTVKDNWVHLDLIAAFPGASIVAFAMSPLGLMSRVLGPLVGGYFTYASIEVGKESAPGQITITDMVRAYATLEAA
jgi:3-dehydroquinate dehydratase type I